MVISNKPLQFILAAFLACIPLASFGSTTVDSIYVKTEAANPVHGSHKELNAHEEKEFNASELINSHIEIRTISTLQIGMAIQFRSAFLLFYGQTMD